jgi:pyruvate,orthophosphate dikinase
MGEHRVSPRWSYSFADGASLPDADRVAEMGGKGAALARMTALGLPVPPGFTLTTGACHRVLADGWSDDLDAVLAEGVAALEATLDRRLGDGDRPLLVSVRSGAPISMPGMMDTVLNAGMTDAVAEALGHGCGDARFGWDTARRFVQSYAAVVLHAPSELLSGLSRRHLGADEGASLDDEGLRAAGVALRSDLETAGYEIPDDPAAQIRAAVEAVFASWNSDRAQVYRDVEGIDASLGTAATVQAMTFGNLGDRSGTGVVFSRDPSTGAPGMIGDFLVGTQGEDVVAGTHQTEPISAMAQRWPSLSTELEEMVDALETDLTDLADIEFTVEEGTLWLLQVRRGKRSPRAALRIAIDMVEDTNFPLDAETALERIAPQLADPPMVPVATDDVAGEELTSGLAGSPGLVAGAICTDVDEAIAAGGRGEAVILVRRETSPADVAGMAAARGIVTAFGGLVSHAAVVARGWGVPAVVGASDLDVRTDGVSVNGRFLANGTVITVNGDDGAILLGAHVPAMEEVPELAVVRGWAESTAPAPSAPTEQIDEREVERVLGLKGMGDAATVANILDVESDAVAALLAALVESGDAQELPQGRVRLLPDAVARVTAMYAADAARLSAQIEPVMDRFHVVNDAFKQVVTDWQMRTVDGAQTPNDHTDVAHDAGITARLRTEIHAGIEPIIAEVSAADPRLGRYTARLVAALEAVEAGEADMFAHPLKDSYHTVWFELHEELIRLSGRNRADEAAAGRA